MAKERLREALRREGHYLLGTNLSEQEPARLWTFYTQLTHVEEAFKNLKGDLAIRRSFTRTYHESKRIFSWPSWPIACR